MKVVAGQQQTRRKNKQAFDIHRLLKQMPNRKRGDHPSSIIYPSSMIHHTSSIIHLASLISHLRGILSTRRASQNYEKQGETTAFFHRCVIILGTFWDHFGTRGVQNGYFWDHFGTRGVQNGLSGVLRGPRVEKVGHSWFVGSPPTPPGESIWSNFHVRINKH